MNEVVTRTNADGITWREVAPLTQRIPPCGPASAPVAPLPRHGNHAIRVAAEPGERLSHQEYIAANGSIRRADLPETTEPGRWREVIEGDRRVVAFEYVNGGRRCIAVD